MKSLPRTQKGASLLGSALTLLFIGYFTYLFIQFVPQWLEFRAIENVLSTLEQQHASNPVGDVMDARTRVNNMLFVNEMADRMDLFGFQRRGNTLEIEAKYSRDINLVFGKHTIDHEKKISLPL